MQADFRQLLFDEPAVKASAGSSAFLRQLRHLVLRNLGGLLVETDETADEALRLYVEALEIDPDDVVLWHRAGTLVSFDISKGLAKCSPNGLVALRDLLPAGCRAWLLGSGQASL